MDAYYVYFIVMIKKTSTDIFTPLACARVLLQVQTVFITLDFLYLINKVSKILKLICSAAA